MNPHTGTGETKSVLEMEAENGPGVEDPVLLVLGGLKFGGEGGESEEEEP
jgi:hypothetical protein